jgi:hypothetical protein
MRSHQAALILLIGIAAGGIAQNPARLLGELTAKNEGGNQLTLKEDSGAFSTIAVNDKTAYLRVVPGETNLAKAARITLSELTAGDRLLATFNTPGAPAARIIVMAKTDLEQKRAAETSDWQKRGHAGTISAIDPATKKLTVTTRSAGVPSAITVQPGDKTEYRRYAPDSIRFADALPSAWTDLKVGNQVRVLGVREGDTVQAQVIVSGTFRNIAGTITSVDPEESEVRILDLASKQRLIVKAASDSMVRRLPPRMAEMMGNRSGVSVDAQHARPDTDSPSRAAPAERPQTGRRDIQQMLERLPALPLSELKIGDAVIVASTAGKEPGRVTAIALIAGVEPLLREQPPQSDPRLAANWNLDINIVP